jgi:hypothetical protein
MVTNEVILETLSKMTISEQAKLVIILEEILKTSQEPGVNKYDFECLLQKLIEAIEESQNLINK